VTLRSLVDLGLRHAYDLFRKSAGNLKCSFVWRFGFFSHLRTVIFIGLIVALIGLIAKIRHKAITKGDPMVAMEDVVIYQPRCLSIKYDESFG
jgi:hypothetical protein